MSGWKALGFKTYKDYLNSYMWIEKSTNIKIQIGHCQKGGSTSNLNVHHLHYNNVGNEGIRDCIVLCRECHKEKHGNKN